MTLEFKDGLEPLSDHCYHCSGEEHEGDTGELRDFYPSLHRETLCEKCFNICQGKAAVYFLRYVTNDTQIQFTFKHVEYETLCEAANILSNHRKFI